MIDIQLFTKKNETWKIKQRFWKRIEILCDKLQFVCLIGGRVCNPRQQLVLSMYVLALSDYKQPAAAAGYKPAPQIADIYIQRINLNFVYIQK